MHYIKNYTYFKSFNAYNIPIKMGIIIFSIL